MKATKNEAVKISAPGAVDAFMKKLEHPLAEVAEALRQIILNTDPEIGEEIKWNAPAFFYTGEMQAFNPKEYKRHIIVFNLFKNDCIRLVFSTGAKLNNADGFLEGNYADGRRLALFFYNLQEVKSKQKAFQKVIKEWPRLLDK